MTSASLNIALATSVVRHAILAGATDAVISPGSRNTPLVMALSEEAHRGDIKLHTIIDERVAGFYALGLARVTGRPVILSCTSGSAGTHYYPSIVEASRSRIPLIIVTADRPAELHDCGAPQTMNQKDLFGAHVRDFAHIPAPAVLEDLSKSTQAIPSFLRQALAPTPGPINLNMAFRKPLWSRDAQAVEAPVAPPMGTTPPDNAWPAEQLDNLIGKVRSTSRGLFIWGAGEIGSGSGSYVQKQEFMSENLLKLARLLRWPILSDASAGIRSHSVRTPEHIGTSDLILRSSTAAGRLKPELVIRIGGEPTSKAFSSWISNHTKGAAYLLDPSGWSRDPGRTAVDVLAADPAAVLGTILQELSTLPGTVEPSWLEAWQQSDLIAQEAIALSCDTQELWAGSVAGAVNRSLAKGTLLHLASSLSIRSFVSFVPHTSPALTITANRGLNGIDGTIATALGQASRWSEGPTAVLLGDVAFVHDASALAYAPKDRPFIIIVMDNSGGGIFDHLPISEAGPPFERHFITDPKVDLEAIGSAYGLTTNEAQSTSHLCQLITSVSNQPGSHLIVTRFDRSRDLEQHEATWTSAQQMLEGALT